MIHLLLAVIYLSFISLGLPDSLLGSAWPSMYPQLGVGVSSAGLISMIIAGCTILSSLLSDRLVRRLGTGWVTFLSVGLTAVALLGFSLSSEYWMLLLWAIPYGLGAGSVDAALNNFVALHYKARHMNWLHCFWGVGATLGPYVMGACLAGGLGWQRGYRTIALVQAALTAVLLFSLPLWRKKGAAAGAGKCGATWSLGRLLRLPGAAAILPAYFCYCSLELVTGLWGSSYMVMVKGVGAETAAAWIAIFYLGITAGRFLSGVLAGRLSDQALVRLGEGLALTGVAALWLAQAPWLLLTGFVLVGLGCAPIYPSLLHQTPMRFGAEASQAVMGLQMAFAYVGSTFSPPLAGLLAGADRLELLPLLLMGFTLLMILLVETAQRRRPVS